MNESYRRYHWWKNTPQDRSQSTPSLPQTGRCKPRRLWRHYASANDLQRRQPPVRLAAEQYTQNVVLSSSSRRLKRKFNAPGQFRTGLSMTLSSPPSRQMPPVLCPEPHTSMGRWVCHSIPVVVFPQDQFLVPGGGCCQERTQSDDASHTPSQGSVYSIGLTRPT